MHDYLQTELTFLSNLCFKIEETGEAFQICLQKSEKLKELPIISVFSQITQTYFWIISNSMISDKTDLKFSHCSYYYQS